MVVSKHLTHFCYTFRPVLHQHLSSHLAYSGIPRDVTNYSVKIPFSGELVCQILIKVSWE